MAKIYAPPAECPPPAVDYRNFDLAKVQADEDAFIAKLAALARQHNKGDLVGEVVRFPRGDGYAQYLVWSRRPLELIHLPIGDAWQIPEAHARGLRLSDLRRMVERKRLFAEVPDITKTRQWRGGA